MANEQQTVMQMIRASQTNVVTELWTQALATFATKQEAGANYASVQTCEAAIDELT